MNIRNSLAGLALLGGMALAEFGTCYAQNQMSESRDIYRLVDRKLKEKGRGGYIVRELTDYDNMHKHSGNMGGDILALLSFGILYARDRIRTIKKEQRRRKGK